MHHLFFELENPLNLLVNKHQPIKPEPVDKEDDTVDEVDLEIYK